MPWNKRIKDLKTRYDEEHKEDKFLDDFCKGYIKKKPRPPPRKPIWRAIDHGLTIIGIIGLVWMWSHEAKKKYPSQPISTASKALQTSLKTHGQHAPYTDIYVARIPLNALVARVRGFEGKGDALPTRQQLEEAWGRSILGSKILRREACVFGLLTRGKWEPGDLGDGPDGFGLDDGVDRELMNGIMTVQREPGADEDSNGLLVSWKMPDAPRVFFETIAGWGYPWRLMSGGRHEMSISDPYEFEPRKREGLFIDVRFASTHDYEIVHEEGDLSQQKILPGWVNWCHRAYSRLILGSAVRGIVPPVWGRYTRDGEFEVADPPPGAKTKNPWD